MRVLSKAHDHLDVPGKTAEIVEGGMDNGSSTNVEGDDAMEHDDTISDDSECSDDAEVPQSILEDIARFEESFKGISKRYKILDRIGEGW